MGWGICTVWVYDGDDVVVKFVDEGLHGGIGGIFCEELPGEVFGSLQV